MITSLSLLERAKQGDAGAIAALMNDVLQAQDVWVKATLESDCLQVMLKSPAVLHQLTCITFMQRGLLRLQPDAIKQVRAYAWRVGDAFPLWIATFSLEQDSLLQGQLKAVIDQPASASAVMPSGDETSAPSQPSMPTLTLPPPIGKRSELFKLGFVIVAITMVYFVVTGV
ncbi:hypothetical protein [Stenomitos frigidus]|uniref:Uncharacterized protein n=1 Tax=Stenomitos frigidus ULC18 TaxID=2107698 RepID=A0A2T1DU41_9CYAN|nr:hypothetical protein [Stenomitos frigidus]PSB23894.1 hypothetical protein C7B82_29385 [Stenomitos frigidus ULC18]